MIVTYCVVILMMTMVWFGFGFRCRCVLEGNATLVHHRFGLMHGVLPLDLQRIPN